MSTQFIYKLITIISSYINKADILSVYRNLQLFRIQNYTTTTSTGGVGGLTNPALITSSDLVDVTGDNLLMWVRRKLRQMYKYPQQLDGVTKGKNKAPRKWGITAVHTVPTGKSRGEVQKAYGVTKKQKQHQLKQQQQQQQSSSAAVGVLISTSMNPDTSRPTESTINQIENDISNFDSIVNDNNGDSADDDDKESASTGNTSTSSSTVGRSTLNDTLTDSVTDTPNLNFRKCDGNLGTASFLTGSVGFMMAGLVVQAIAVGAVDVSAPKVLQLIGTTPRTSNSRDRVKTDVVIGAAAAVSSSSGSDDAVDADNDLVLNR